MMLEKMCGGNTFGGKISKLVETVDAFLCGDTMNG